MRRPSSTQGCGRRCRAADGNPARRRAGSILVDLRAISMVTALAVTPALAQQETLAPGADTLALCTTWQLTTQAVKLANEVSATALERADRARKLVAECKARLCPREELLYAEQEVREAGYQQVRAGELAAAMEQRRTALLTRFEELRGKDAIEKCGDVSRQ